MITDVDIKKLAKVFTTKDDLKQLNQKLDEIKTRLDVLEDNVTEDIAKLQNENLVTSNYRRDLDNHEERIGAIETKLATAR